MSLNYCTGLCCKECSNKIKEFFKSGGTEGEINEEIKLGDLVEKESQVGVVLHICSIMNDFYVVYNLHTSTLSNKTVSFKEIQEHGWKKFKGTVVLSNK